MLSALWQKTWLSLISCLVTLLSRAHPNICKLYFFNIIPCSQKIDCFNSTVVKQWAKFSHSTDASKVYPIYSNVTEPFLTHTREIKANLTHFQVVKCIGTFSSLQVHYLTGGKQLSASPCWGAQSCTSQQGLIWGIGEETRTGLQLKVSLWFALLICCGTGTKHQKNFPLAQLECDTVICCSGESGGWTALGLHWSMIQIWKNLKSFTLKSWILNCSLSEHTQNQLCYE